MKTVAVLIALLAVVVGAVVLWGTRLVTVNRPATQSVATRASKPADDGGKKIVTLFFLGRGDHIFREERREIEAGATTTENVKRILTELVKGPTTEDLLPTVPRETRLLNLFIDSSGTAYVDFNQGLRDGLSGDAQEELHTVFSIVNTLVSNFIQITRVQILVEGAEISTLAGHVDTRLAVPPQYVF